MIKMTMMRKILENLSQTGEKDGVCHSGEAGLHHHERAGELGDGDHSDGDFDYDGDGGGRVIMTYWRQTAPIGQIAVDAIMRMRNLKHGSHNLLT